MEVNRRHGSVEWEPHHNDFLGTEPEVNNRRLEVRGLTEGEMVLTELALRREWFCIELDSKQMMTIKRLHHSHDAFVSDCNAQPFLPVQRSRVLLQKADNYDLGIWVGMVPLVVAIQYFDW